MVAKSNKCSSPNAAKIGLPKKYRSYKIYNLNIDENNNYYNCIFYWELPSRGLAMRLPAKEATMQQPHAAIGLFQAKSLSVSFL